MYLNHIVVSGEIQRPLESKEIELEDKRKLLIVNLTLHTVWAKKGWKKRHQFLTVKFVGGVAEYVMRKDPRKGDWMAVVGHIEQSAYVGRVGGRRRFTYVSGEHVWFLWGPPNQFVKGHAMIPVDELNRLRKLTEGMSAWTVPEAALAETGEDGEEGDDDG